MRINRTCKICGEKFLAIKVTQFFCSRKCFKRDYYLRTKTRIQDEQQTSHFPIKKCSFCKKESPLTFDPVTSPKLFDAWGCPHCGTTNKLIWQYQSSPRSYQLISEILITIERVPEYDAKPPQFQPYKLPTPKLELGNPHIVVMACGKMDILDIQKKKRKKIIFS